MWSVLAIVIHAPDTGACAPKLMWTPQGPTKPPPYTTVFEVLADQWEPMAPRLSDGSMLMWLRRRYAPSRVGNLVDDAPTIPNPLAGWETE